VLGAIRPPAMPHALEAIDEIEHFILAKLRVFLLQLDGLHR
jgi:hypothetical protein